MSRRRLLIVTFHFAPTAASGTFRMHGFARHLPGSGWDSVVVAPAVVPWEPTDPGLVDELPREVAVESIRWPSDIAWRPLRMVEPYSPWMIRGLRTSLKIIDRYRPDAVLTTGPPHLTHWIGLQVKRRHGIPWVADFRDPWMTKEAGTPVCGAARSRLRKTVLARLERAVLRRADVVLCTAPGATACLQAAYPDEAAKVTTLTNGYDPERFPKDTPPAPADRLRLTHAGEIYAGRDPLPLLDAVAALEGRARPTSVVFLGQMSRDEEQFREEVGRRGLESIVQNMGQVPYDRALREMADSEILLLLDSPGRRVGIPAKLFEYLGTGRPVLALGEADGDLAWALRESRIVHRIAAPRDVPGICRAIAELAEIARQPAGRMNDRGPWVRFTRAQLAAQLATLLDASVQGCSGTKGAGNRRRAFASSVTGP